MRLTPDNFRTVSNDELRELWRMHRDLDVRRLILEVYRARRSLADAHSLAIEVKYALWARDSDRLNNALEPLIEMLLQEKIRLGATTGVPPGGPRLRPD
ncbi:hypothetical protein [Burkholderia multivorans]|uniref:hypothetical protein n=1 Tax=Burkholderia multivorans TaxID=87883 RepID=UPI000CFFB858|nr:hypothetical protein [Burkholderia multivorans]PRG16833.1 hypothetical protein C6T62_29840 [Burkholderia multivorans]